MSDFANVKELEIIDTLPGPENPSFQTIHFMQIKLNPRSKSISYEMNKNILSARESYIKSHEHFGNQCNVSLEDLTLEVLDSISTNEICNENINENKIQELQNQNEEMRKQDILRLYEMLEIIDKFDEHKIELKCAFIHLGDLSGGSKKVHYNDKDANCIRNKYGYIKRHDRNSINENGINFEKLYQMKIVFDSNSERDQEVACQTYIDSHFIGLQTDLLNIRKSLIYILSEEKQSLCDRHKSNVLSEPQQCNMEHIIRFVNTFYYPMILRRIESEISNIDTVNFNLKEDRYYLARKLIIIGEFSREILENNTQIDDESVEKVFKKLKTLRNKIIHSHCKISNGISDSEKSKNLNELISRILIGLKECIEKGTLKKDFNYIELNKSIEDFDKILFSSDSSRSLEEKHVTVLNSDSSKTKDNSTKKDNKNRAEVIKLIIKAQKILSKTPENKVDLNDLDELYQNKLKLLGNEHSDDYPIKLDATHSDLIEIFIENLQKSKKIPNKISNKCENDQTKDLELSNRLSDSIKQLVIETDFLAVSENPNFLKRSKRTAVIEHCVSVIGQIMRDITDLNSSMKVLDTSNIIDFASKSATGARNQGLAHNIFAYDRNCLEKQIQNNILPANKHFMAILTIFKKNDCEVSGMTLISIACSFFNLGFFDNAIDYFKRTLKYISEHPSSDHTRSNLFKFLFQIEVTKDFEELMGMDLFSFTCRLLLMKTYMTACKYDESYNQLEILKKRMQIQQIMHLQNDSMSCFVYDIYNSLVHCLLIKGMNRKCIEILNEIIPISNYPLFEIHLSWAYHFENEPLKAYQIIHKHVPFNFDPTERYISLYRYVRILAYQPNKKESIVESIKWINEMEKIFQENRRIFKEKYNDEFLIMQSHLIRLKVQLLVDECCVIEDNEENNSKILKNLEDSIKKFHSIIRFLKYDLTEDVRIASMYFWFCRAYSSLITNQIKNVDKEKKKLENAQMFFDQARTKFNSFRRSDRLSVSSVKEMIKTADFLANGYNKFATRSDLNKEQKEEYLSKAIPYLSMVKQYMDYYNKLPKQ